MPRRGWITSFPFVVTVAISSASLFLLEPMFATMVLPYLGGSPSVWTTCMLFFQVGLLGGYLYSHACSSMRNRSLGILHLALLAAACLFLPPIIGHLPASNEEGSPVIWLLAQLATTIGLPFLVLASTAPLMQVWLSRSGASSAADPYYLYAASNAGSLLGLLAYPFLFEPLLNLRQQASVWSICFGVLTATTIFCAGVLWKQGNDLRSPHQTSMAHQASNLKPGSIPKWILLSFLPSSLLLSVTVHLTADVASVPLLWIVPLAVYLATYVLAFSSRGDRIYRFWIRWLPLVILTLVVVLLTEATEPPILIASLHLLGLFWIGMVCHGGLSRTRPAPARLTSFYLCIAIGGAIGGVFNALLAPLLFNSLAEYPAALALACFAPLFSTGERLPRPKVLDVVLPALLAFLTGSLLFAFHRTGAPVDRVRDGLIIGVPLVVCYVFSDRPIRFGLGIAGLLMCSALSPGVHGKLTERVRSFYGIHRITTKDRYQILIHGDTEHGRQSLDSARRGEPLSYYYRSGPIGDVLGSPGLDDPRLQKVAVLGLGAGSLSAYASAGQHWDFYEIDSSIIDLARRKFTFLQDAINRGATLNVIHGDARLKIARSPVKYGVIILDAFSSDSIPTHLFTREAFQIYRDRLLENGFLVVHCSSRYFDLQPVIGRLAGAANPPLMAMIREDLWLTDEEKIAGKGPSKWVVLFQGWDDPLLPKLRRAGWLPVEAKDDRPPWTDDHANVLAELKLKQKQ